MSNDTPAVATLKKREDGGPYKYRNAAGISASQDEPDVFLDSVEKAESLAENAPFLVKAEGLEEIVERCGTGVLPKEYQEEGAALADDTDDGVDELLAGTIPEIEDALATGDYDDVLDVVEATENAEQGREGVQDAVDGRREELADQDQEE